MPEDEWDQEDETGHYKPHTREKCYGEEVPQWSGVECLDCGYTFCY